MSNSELVFSFAVSIFIYFLLSFFRFVVSYKSVDTAAGRSKVWKSLVNYGMSVNSSFVIVGTLSEAYLYGVRMVGNILSVLLGFLYASYLVLPVLHSLEHDIKTPFEYFSRRYNGNKWAQFITALACMTFYLSFLSLYLWGCAVLVSTVIPLLPLSASCIIIGLFSLTFSIFSAGGASFISQYTKINILQLIVAILGIMLAIMATLIKLETPASQMWSLAVENRRFEFIEKRVDTTTRYTILNQLVSLSIPWTAMHSLFLPNFLRYKSIKQKIGSLNRGRLFVISSSPLIIALNLLLIIAGGLVVFIQFYGCSPLDAQKVVNKNQIGVYWLYLTLKQVSPLFCGCVFASIIYYSVVQHSMGIALVSNTIFSDIISPIWPSKSKQDQLNRSKMSRTIALILGILSIFYAISFSLVKNTMVSLFFVFNNSIHSPLLGLFILSAFNPYANFTGAMLAFCSNLVINGFLAAGSVLVSNQELQEYKTGDFNCENPFFRNMTTLNLYNSSTNINHFHSLSKINEYSPVLKYLFSIAPIWYCLFSLMYTIILGSALSLIYSLIKTRSFDADSKFRVERKKFLYYYDRSSSDLRNDNNQELHLNSAPLLQE